MNLAMTIFSMITAWMATIIAMLWGLLRVSRRYPPYAQCLLSMFLHSDDCQFLEPWCSAERQTYSC